MKPESRTPLVALAALALLLVASAAPAWCQSDEPVTPPVDYCDINNCEDCPPANVVDLAQYFVPNYPGWATAKKIWIDPSGGTSHMRFFSYAPNKYELIKFANNRASETYYVGAHMISLTVENNINNSTQSRTYPIYPLDWMPRYGCRYSATLNDFDFCHGGEYYYNNCVFSHSYGGHCGIFKSKVRFLGNYNYGYNVGVVDTIVKVNKLDDRSVENYYYGRNKGFLRWEYINPSGVMTNWGQQIGEEPNSPLVHQGCFQP